MRPQLLLLCALGAAQLAPAQFEIIETGLAESENLFDMSFPTNDVGYAVGGGEERSVILRTTDGGDTWEEHIDEDTNWLYGVSFINADTGMACGYNGVLYKTTDGGDTWMPMVSGTTQWIMSIDMVSADTAYCAGNSGVLLKTTDGGTTWTPQNSGSGMWLLSIFFTNANTGYCVGTFSAAQRTIDGGATWTPFDPGTESTFSDIFFVNDTLGFCTGFVGTLIRTIDGGDTWEPLDPGTSADLQSVHFFSVNEGYVVGDGATILRTFDGGDTWTPVSSPSELDNTEVVVLHGNVVVCGDAGLLMIQENTTRTHQIPVADPHAPYPNPTTGLFTIDMDGSAGPVAVEVYDATGKLCAIATHATGAMVGMDLRHLQSGLYRVLVRADGEFRWYAVVNQ